MFRTQLRGLWLSFTDIFSFRDDDAKGRTVYLGCVLLNAFYNVFITGLFYTGFLSMYGMSITDAGIVTFIPFIGNLFSIFSSQILARFKRRKPVLIASKIYFYAMYILATTIMPVFVIDMRARLIWFCVLIFLAYALYAPFTPGFTIWFYRFYPADNERRTRYLLLQQVFASVMSSLVLVFSSVLTDAVANSPHQNELILGFRYLAFILVLIEIAVQAQAKEYPSSDAPKLRISKVFTEPFKYKKFIYCMLLMFVWNFNSNVSNGLWNYHLLNHFHFSYTLINSASVMYTIILLTTSNLWKKLLRRYSWIKTFGIALILWVPTEWFFFSMTAERVNRYLPLCFLQNLLNVGINLSYANILYMNLPKENETAHIAFNTLGCNLFAFLGLLFGTFLSSISGDSTMHLLGMDVYSVQFTCLTRGVIMGTMGLILVAKWRSFTRDEDIEELEQDAALRKRERARRRAMPDVR